MSGTLAELGDQAVPCDDDSWLRIRVHEKARPGLADEVRDLFGESVVDVQVELGDRSRRQKRKKRRSAAPQELFAEFLAEREVDDQRLIQLFDELYEEQHQGSP